MDFNQNVEFAILQSIIGFVNQCTCLHSCCCIEDMVPLINKINILLKNNGRTWHAKNIDQNSFHISVDRQTNYVFPFHTFSTVYMRLFLEIIASSTSVCTIITLQAIQLGSCLKEMENAQWDMQCLICGAPYTIHF